jgi:hypothetical protein
MAHRRSCPKLHWQTLILHIKFPTEVNDVIHTWYNEVYEKQFVSSARPIEDVQITLKEKELSHVLSSTPAKYPQFAPQRAGGRKIMHQTEWIIAEALGDPLTCWELYAGLYPKPEAHYIPTCSTCNIQGIYTCVLETRIARSSCNGWWTVTTACPL